MPIKDTYGWIKTCIPDPTDKDRTTQFGCLLEEVAETVNAIGADPKTVLQLERTSQAFKDSLGIFNLSQQEKVMFLDGLCDVIVTAVTSAYAQGFDIVGAMREVNRANYSKFEDGKPLFNEQHKVLKGNNYIPPDLTPYI